MSSEHFTNAQPTAIKSHLKVAVLAGGIGEERQVSIQSGNCVAGALSVAGVNVTVADITSGNMEILEDEGIDVFFVALHGRFGEDGQLQQILEDKSLIYTGSGPAASKLTFDKIASKKVFAKTSINTPKAVEFDNETDIGQLEKQLEQLAAGYVIKPIRQGSSVGVSIVSDRRKVVSTAQQCLAEFGDCMIEEFIEGRELTVSILCNQPLPIIEIQTKRDFYDYHAKYVDQRTKFLFDTITDSVLTKKIQQVSLDCFNALGCSGFGRVDFMMGEDEKIYVLEVNTIPGFTTHSLLPMAAAKMGLSMSDLCIEIIEAALKKREVNTVH